MVTNFIAKWRIEKGISKAQLARRVGVDRSYITKLEQGKKQPSGEMMFRFAKYLGQPLEEIFQYAQGINEKPVFFGQSDALKAIATGVKNKAKNNFPFATATNGNR